MCGPRSSPRAPTARRRGRGPARCSSSSCTTADHIGHTDAVLFADLVATSTTVASTPARSTKIAALADLLRRLAPEEVTAAVGFLVGDVQQGRTGVGWA